ncbi:MAG: matrixin family metalloprotease [Phycisphaerales bacterium]
MNCHYSLLTTATAITMLTGGAYAAQAVPVGIASANELELQNIARTVIHSLTPAEKEAIVAQDGIGAEALDLASWSWAQPGEARQAEIPSGISATEWLEMCLNDDLRASLNEQELAVLFNMAQLLDQGQELPFFCFSPDANPDYAFLINELLDYQFVSEGGPRFQQGNRWSRTAVDGSGLNQGDATTITYSFVPDGTFVPNGGLGSGNSTLFAWLDGRYGSTAVWQDLFHQVFDRWAELTGLTYIWETNDDGSSLNGAVGFVGVRGDVRIAAFNYPFDGNGGVLAYNSFPNDGDMAIDAYDNFYNNTNGNSLRLRNVIAHEHGHGLGMAHVCPSSSSKLMEPFIALNFDGPQLDDILNGHRHYGDPFEPTDNFNDAIDLGTFGSSGFASLDNISIDDDSDFDIFKIELTDRAKITFALSPDADEYRSGPQTTSCTNGTLVDYDSIQDLKIDLFAADDLFTPVASEDSNGAGGIETLVYDAEDPGVYYAIVLASSNVNNVQRYLINMFTTPLPPVECPADLNEDGNLDFFDVSQFLSAFSGMQPDGDFNNDGNWDFFDISGFLNAFSNGCP